MRSTTSYPAARLSSALAGGDGEVRGEVGEVGREVVGLTAVDADAVPPTAVIRTQPRTTRPPRLATEALIEPPPERP
ncbi:hypothetical protein [Streptomyces acidiscabies]|uniref:Uncharacterized protein n=1 Tax=Streptomyces acidiscabies TaxID=42234 RepID=A0AAP6BJ95_9ACTN|nr:hypothetical protein [Streptomyces acidiscabies]MBP5938654.1 hypothetical protein [Streptomyces sp. LBUM 1476]MBZ3909757.1 hypothetical protein [Streptomyces acidiscabies]MDX2965786.1 hypothetical protein [Streptomyces acidiscabies]MDX3025252.1 hypothetical protein [Streptomyces acidiscabies]MDX3795622.1 hypothetical protein [Streptomyces acidiscabies]